MCLCLKTDQVVEYFSTYFFLSFIFSLYIQYCCRHASSAFISSTASCNDCMVRDSESRGPLRKVSRI